MVADAAAFRRPSDATSTIAPAATKDESINAMRAEHCAQADSSAEFTVMSYEVTTSSQIEWTLVTDPTAVGLASLGLGAWPPEMRTAPDLPGPDQPRGAAQPRRRKPTPLNEFEEQRLALSNRLLAVGGQEFSREALLGCRLFTGPMSVKYNAALLASQPNAAPPQRKRLEELNQGNGYAMTIRVIHDAVRTLSRLTVCCPLYRGLTSNRLPEPLRVANEFGSRIAVDTGFISASSSMERALDYAEVSDAVVLEISQSMSCIRRIIWFWNINNLKWCFEKCFSSMAYSV